MYIIDTSSLVHAWDTYPIENFPRFWDWLEGEFRSGSISISTVAYVEVGHVSPEAFGWLKGLSIKKCEITNAVVVGAQHIKSSLGISDDLYSSGVDENDILIISIARVLARPLISNEAKQPSLPQNEKKYKIPAVCNLPSVNVRCLDIAELIKSSGQVF